MRFRSGTLRAGFLALVLLLLTACGSTPPAASSGQPQTPAPPPVQQGPKILRIGLNADPPQLDPKMSTAFIDRIVYASLYDKLVDIDEKLNIKPMLAETWEISNAGKTYVFHLKKGVTFHDGTPFDAAAVKFNWERDLEPDSQRRAELSAIDKVTVVDGSTVQVDLKAPFAPFLAQLSDRAGMMVSPTAAQKAGKDFGLNPVGTGPFLFKNRVKGDTIEFVKNPKYWQAGLPKLDGVVFKAVTDDNTRVVQLKSGSLDLIDRVPPPQLATLKTDPSLKVDEVVGLGYQGIHLNTTRPPFDDKNVRLAFALAIDRQQLVQVALPGAAVASNESPFPPGMWAADGAPVPARDVARAKELLAGKSVDVDLLVSAGDATEQRIAEIIQNMVKDAGINVKIDQVEFGKFLDALNKKNYQAGRLGWSGRSDPDGNSYSFWFTGAPNNDMGYDNPTVNKLLDQQRLTADQGQRKALLQQAVDAIRADMPYIYLWHSNDYKLYLPTVRGYVHVPDGLIRTVAMDIQK